LEKCFTFIFHKIFFPDPYAVSMKLLDEDRSRARSPRAAHVLGLFRRVTVSFAIPWVATKKKKRPRTAARGFQD
jgi:hypothetical protein